MTMGIKDSKDIIYYPNGEKKEFIWDYEVNKNFSSSFRPDMVETMKYGNEEVVYKISINGKSLQQCFDECYEKNIKVNLGDVDLPPMKQEVVSGFATAAANNIMGFPVKYKPVIEEVKIYGELYFDGEREEYIKKMFNSPIVLHPLKNNQLKIDGEVCIYQFNADLGGDVSYIEIYAQHSNSFGTFYFEITKMKFCAVPQYFGIYDETCFSYLYENEEDAKEYFTLYCELMKNIVKYKEWKFVIDMQFIKKISKGEHTELIFDSDTNFASALFNIGTHNFTGKQSEIIFHATLFSGVPLAFEANNPYEELNRIMVCSALKIDDENQRIWGGRYSTPYERILNISYSGWTNYYNCSTVQIRINPLQSYNEFSVEVVPIDGE